MQRLSQQMYEQSVKDFDSDFRKYIGANFKRFLDDPFLIFTRSEDQLTQFHYLRTLPKHAHAIYCNFSRL